MLLLASFSLFFSLSFNLSVFLILSLSQHASAAEAALRLRWYGLAFATSFAFVLLSLSSPLLMLPPQPVLSRQRLLSPSLSSILLPPCLRGLNLLLASPTAACLCSQVGGLVAPNAPVCCGARALMFRSSQLHDVIPLNLRCPTVRRPLSRSSHPMHLQLSFSFLKEKRTHEQVHPCISSSF